MDVEVKLKDMFNPFMVVPWSTSELTVSQIELEVFALKKFDGSYSSTSFSILNGLFLNPEAWPSPLRNKKLLLYYSKRYSTTSCLCSIGSPPSVVEVPLFYTEGVKKA